MARRPPAPDSLAGAARAVLVLGALLAPCAASAGQWYLAPYASGATRYDDNIQLLRDDAEDSFGILWAAGARLGVRGERGAAVLDARSEVTEYPVGDDLETRNQFFELDAHHDTELSRWQLEARFVRDTTLTSEVEDTGLLAGQRRREFGRINPSWSRRLGERTHLTFAYDLEDATFAGADPSGPLDHRYHLASTRIDHALDARQSVFAQLFGSRYQAPDLDVETDTVGLRLGARRRVLESLEATAFLGARRSDSSFRSGRTSRDDDTVGVLAGASLLYKGERDVVDASYERDLFPSSGGQVQESDRVIVRWRRDLSPRLQFLLVGRLIVNDSDPGPRIRPERYLVSVEPQLRWRLTEALALEASYRYRRQHRDGRGSADSNAVVLYATYRWSEPPPPR